MTTSPAVPDGPPVRTGADVAAADNWQLLSGRRVGVFSNPSGILPDTRQIVDDLVDHGGAKIVGLFGPEHGFRGSARAGSTEGDLTDPRTGLPVFDATADEIIDSWADEARAYDRRRQPYLLYPREPAPSPERRDAGERQPYGRA